MINKITEINNLVETIRVELYENTVIAYNLNLHCQRLFQSLCQLNFKNEASSESDFRLFIYNQIKNFLQYEFKSVCGFKENSIPENKNVGFKLYKLRLIYQRNGEIKKTVEVYTRELNRIWAIKILKKDEFHIDSNNPIWRYKFLPRPTITARQDADEIIWTNEKNQICEGSFTNIFWIKDGQWYTPSLDVNILAGVMRVNILAKYKVQENSAGIEALKTADTIYLSNALIGLQEAKLH